MKKLFAVKDSETGKVLPEYFGNKKDAKARRDQLNKEGDKLLYVVTPGPDHHKSN